jgi:hypothetical protein
MIRLVSMVGISLFLALAAPAAAVPPTRESRLEALDPKRPLDYLELAEEIADGLPPAGADDERQLARRLFALAGLLDRERLGRSASLGLLTLETDRLQRQRLEAVARLLAPTASVESAAVERIDPDAAVAVSEAFSSLRRGRGSQGTSALRVPGADDLLERHGVSMPGGAKRFREDLRVFRSGSMRPEIDAARREAMFAVDDAILSAAAPRPDGRFSTDLARGGDAPLLEVDTLRLETVFGTDVSRPIFRGGQWVPVPADGG